MTVELMTLGFNEEFLAPFFFNHYKWVDKIHFFCDTDTTDNTRQIAEQYPNVVIHDFTFPDGMDDIIKTEHFNQFYKTLSSDWVMLVDMDEFVFIDEWDELTLETTRENVIFCLLYNVYRHTTEADLTINKPIKEQRRHGYLDLMYRKPVLFRSGMNIRIDLGNHRIAMDGGEWLVPDEYPRLDGAHWAMADPCFVFDRRIKNRRLRQSQSNLDKGLTAHHHQVTEESIWAELKAHENDPRVF